MVDEQDEMETETDDATGVENARTLARLPGRPGAGATSGWLEENSQPRWPTILAESGVETDSG